MIRILAGILLAVSLTTVSATAQELRALAKADLTASSFQKDEDALTLLLVLSLGVPYRISTLTEPKRLLLEFRELDISADFSALSLPEGVNTLRPKRSEPGWTALEFELDQPLGLDTATLSISAETSKALLELSLSPRSEEDFQASAKANTLPDNPQILNEEKPLTPVIVLDPGHGGVDPGAQRGGFDEADLMLQFAVELRDMLLLRGAVDVALTRTDDVFVSLPERVSRARAAKASAFLSLHADALAQGRASGTTIYTLSGEASDQASALLAERQDRQDIIRGVDLTALDDDVAIALMDLARGSTAPKSKKLAEALVTEMRSSLGKLHKRPLMEAGFSVLKAPDIPSVLIELGFMSSEVDLKNLSDPVWRSLAAEGIANAIEAWIAEN